MKELFQMLSPLILAWLVHAFFRVWASAKSEFNKDIFNKDIFNKDIFNKDIFNKEIKSWEQN